MYTYMTMEIELLILEILACKWYLKPKKSQGGNVDNEKKKAEDEA